MNQKTKKTKKIESRSKTKTATAIARGQLRNTEEEQAFKNAEKWRCERVSEREGELEG